MTSEYERITTATSPYEVLGVAPRASLAEIKVAHRALMRRYHPDVYAGPAAQAHAASAALNVAWSTVSDPFMRARADRLHHVTARECPRCKGRGTVTQQQGFKGKVRLECPACKGSGVQE